MHLNIYAIPSIIAFILTGLVGLYVFYKNPHENANKIFLLFSVFVILFCLGESMVRLSDTQEEALFWSKIGYVGSIFGPMTILHFSFIFPKKHTKSNTYKYMLFGIYSICVNVLILFNQFVSIQNVQWSEWGYRVALSSSTSFVGIWVIAILLFTAINLFKKFIKANYLLQKKQIKFILYGVLITLILGTSTNIIPPLLGIEIFPMAAIGMLIFSLFVASAILKYNLFLFKPMVKPTFEERKAEPKRYEIEPSRGYIIREIREERGYEIFIDQIIHGIGGLCITKYSPKKIRDEYALKKTPILWFTFKQSNKETTVNPKKLDVELILQIEDFVKKGKRTIVYMDCLDQIALVRGIENTLTLIKDIKNICRENHSILLLSINTKMFDEKQLSILEKEFLEVK